ncbi:MAG: hypothetical protein ABFR63_09165 [Thermodesulfobacteriota bacterium]
MKSLLLLPFLFLFGCAHLGTMDSTAERLRHLDRDLANQEFDKALAILDDASQPGANDAALKKERKIVLEQLHLYEKQVIATALKQERKNDWYGAKQTYHRSLEKAGKSLELKEAQLDMLERFQERMETLETEELIVNGEWLRRRLPLLEKQHLNDPESSSLKRKYFKAKEEAETTGMELLQLGEKMLAEKNLEMARRTLPLAVKLLPGGEAKGASARLNKKFKAKKKKVQQGRDKVAKKKNKKDKEKDKIEIEAFNDALASGKFSLARQHLANISPATGGSLGAELRQDRLDRATEAFVQERESIGDAFYRVGEYELAIKEWHRILELEPDNEVVKNKMARAERIVEKLKAVRDRQE